VRMHRNTPKARGALQVMFEISGENPEWLHNDHKTVYAAYAALQALEYEWVTAKQEWAFVGVADSQPAPFFSVACPAFFQGLALEILKDGATLHDVNYENIARVEIVFPDGSAGVMFFIEVQP